MTEAVIVLDMTNDSVNPAARSVEQRKKILPQTKKFLEWARSSGRQVIFVCSARRSTDKWFFKWWEKANMIWTEGAQPLTELYDKSKDIIVHKRRYSGFFSSDLDVTLRELGANSLILLGWSTSLAVLTTAIDAWQLGFETSVLSDLTIAHAWGGKSVDDQQAWSLEAIKAFAKSTVTTSTELMK